jgi:protein TonB
MKSEFWLNRTLIDVVFEGRHKTYGAFDLRTHYERNMAKAMLISIAVFISTWLLFSMWLNRDKIQAVMTDPPTVVDLDKYVPTMLPVVRPPASLPPSQPASTSLVTPAVVDDEQPIDENEIPPQESLQTTTGPVDVAGGGEGFIEGVIGNGTVDAPITVITEPAEPETPFNFYEVDKLPLFPGGEKAMYEYLQKNLQYPLLARESNLSGTVVVRFVVNKKGDVEEVEVLRSPSKLFNAEAMRVIQNMPPWEPASRKGKPVSTFYIIPLKFQLL